MLENQLRTVPDTQAASLVARRAISKDEVTVVLPTLNEADAIEVVIDELRKQGYNKILIVDGYSTDGTPELARERGAVVISQIGTGKTGALATAIRYVNTPFLLVMDADCTYDPRNIEQLLAHANSYDEIIGARTNGVQHIPRINRLGNWFLSWFFRLLFSVRIGDVCSGMYLLRSDSARSLQLSTGGFDAEVEITAQLAASGRVAEVPISYRARVGRQKLSSLRDGIRIATSTFRLTGLYNPVLLFSAVMALAIAPATVILAWVIYERLVLSIWHSGYALFGVMLFLLASQAFSVATISILIKRSEQRTRASVRNTLNR